MTVYPNGYGSQMVTLGEMKFLHGDKMHPEFARRFFAYMEHKQGELGIGGGWRSTQPDKPGFAPDGKSFHQDQRFASGRVGYCAVDLVEPDGPDGNNAHDGVEWEDTADAAAFGLHTFITGEPWHIQPIEIRGWQTWFNQGQQDPDPNFVLPSDTTNPEPPPVIPPKDAPTMFLFVITNGPGAPVPETWTLCDGTQLSHVKDGHAAAVYQKTHAQVIRSASALQTEGLIKSCRTMNPCPPEWQGTGWQTLWDSRK